MTTTIYRGGVDTERLYLRDLEWTRPTGERVRVSRSRISDDPDNTARLEEMIARHVARYGLVGLFCRPHCVVLDFPCGSGYAAGILGPLDVKYEGLDGDPITVEFAQRVYGAAAARFEIGDLTQPRLAAAAYDVIGCIEGLEHIGSTYQPALLAAFEKALKPGGVLVISSPENPTGRSGQSLTNEDHVWELTRSDFVALLHEQFVPDAVEIVTHRAVLDPGGSMTCLYGICHKP